MMVINDLLYSLVDLLFYFKNSCIMMCPQSRSWCLDAIEQSLHGELVSRDYSPLAGDRVGLFTLHGYIGPMQRLRNRRHRPIPA